MNVIIHQSNPHTTCDGHQATYAVIHDALTAKRLAMFQVVDMGENVTQYRTVDKRSMPPDFTFDDAIKLAMVDEHQRRAQRPPKVTRKSEPPWFPAHYREVRPMHLQTDRGYRQTPVTAPPMRRRLCDKLREHADERAVA